jgi:glycosyltransferase involved in cell wall biosynthesis
MPVLHLSSGKGFGGGERHVLELARALAARGHVVHVGARPDGALWARLKEFPEIRLHPVAPRNAVDVFAARKLIRLIRSEKIEVVHAHYARDYPVVAGAVRRLRMGGDGPAFFLTRHHYLPMTRHPLYRKWLSVADGLIAVSETVKRTVCDSLGCPPERVTVIPNWVDAARFAIPLSKDEARARFDLSKGAFMIGMVNQISPAKGQRETVEAFLKLREAFPDAVLALAGSEAGGTGFTDELKTLIASRGGTDAVRWLGFTDDVPAFLRACDVAAIASHDEAFSIGVLEAWAAGVPLAASRVGGIAELVTDDVTGILFEPRDGEGLHRAFERLARDATLRERLVAAGRAAVTRYSVERATNLTERLYVEVLEKGKKRNP